MKSNRGIALLIVLLVTALLIALIFEFAYATRISLNSAVNFRDSQRAYFLARSGIYAFVKYPKIQDIIPQGEWGIVPMISEGDTQVRIKWEDEAGKIKITDVKNDKATQSMVQTLFGNKSIDTAVYDRMVDPASTIYGMPLLSGLHQFMSDEEYSKVYYNFTATSQVPSRLININTASLDVLQSLGIPSGDAGLIIENRRNTPYTEENKGSAPGVPNMQINNLNLNTYLTTKSTIYKVYSYATVGGYTKQIEAIIQRGNATPLYWRAL